MISRYLGIEEWVALGVLFGLFVAQMYWYGRYLAATARKIRRDKKSKAAEPEAENPLPGVTVIVCAHNERENLSAYLQALLMQDYPEYEVIVVDDGSEDDTRRILEDYAAYHPHLHITFVPCGARVGSTKKLALTLAAKSAQYEYLLLTDADCVPESNQWIREMMKGFQSPITNHQSPIDIVLGFSPYFEEPGSINRLVRYDTLFNGLHYLGAALCGHPYMGVGRNLAYRKSLFFNSGGFTHLMTNKAGDDDLFVNLLATKQNTAVVVHPNAYIWSLPKRTLKAWWQQKRRHLSVSPAYRSSTKFRLTLEPLTRGLFYAAVIGIGIVYQLSLVTLIALGLFLIRWIVQTILINVSARRMGLKRFAMGSILWFDIILPLINLWMIIIPKRQAKW